jgi:IS30 family transposase
MSRKSKGHLTLEERCQIEAFLKSDKSINWVAKQLNVSQSTISRETSRNKGLHGYDHKVADRKAVKRKLKTSNRIKKNTPEMLGLIKNMLITTQASPEQISGRLKQFYGIFISHESIYQFIFEDQKNGGSLYLHLRRQRKKYNKKNGKTAGRGVIPGRVDIDLRPKIVEEKNRFGDLEVDLVVGASHKGVIVTAVDRASKLSLFRILAHKTAEAVTNAICEMLFEFAQKGLLKSITSDNGKEFSQHQKISAILKVPFFFAKPYHSWESGLNEHTNGLLRQYLPKKTSFCKITQQEVDLIQYKINNRPRKVLQYLTPAEKCHLLVSRELGYAFRA